MGAAPGEHPEVAARGSLDANVRRVREQGREVMDGVDRREQWTMFFCDPFGNPIEVKGFRSLATVYDK